MTSTRYRSSRLLGLFCGLVCAALLAATFPSDAAAQGIRRGGGPKGKKGPDTPPPRDNKSQDIPGSLEGRIIKFTLADDADREKDEDLIGILKLRPFKKGERVLTVSVRRSSGLDVSLSSHKYEPEDLKDVLISGLHITAGWGYVDPEAKRKVKELRSLNFNTIEVEGTVELIEDSVIVLKCKPRNDQPWPGTQELDPGKPVNVTKKKRVPFKKLKLKVLEEVSQIVNEDAESISLSDLETGKTVHARVVFGFDEGYVVTLGPPDVTVSDAPKGDQPAGGQPPPGGRGPRPRGPQDR